MKTADLIPLILIELADDNKYGFELTKAIEDKSNQLIQIKQPTLYTVLKKLEKSKFISSYWEDSEIGGKRHYYKITENGKAQIATLPSFEQCIQNILASEQEESEVTTSAPLVEEKAEEKSVDNAEQPATEPPSKLEQFNATFAAENAENAFNTDACDNQVAESEQDASVNNSAEKQVDNTSLETAKTEYKEQPKEESKFVSIMDLIADNAEEQKSEPDTPSVINPAELFNNDSIDHKTEMEVNKDNSALLKNQEKQQAEQFAENKQISKFVEKVPTPKPIVKDVNELEQKQEDLTPKQTNADYAFDDIKYVDYVNFKTKKEYIYAKKVAKLSLLKTFAVAIYALIMMIICGVAVKGHASWFYYSLFIVAIVGTLCYLAVGIKSNENLRLKAQQSLYKPNFKHRAIFACIITLIILVLSIISSVSVGDNTIYSIFSGNNFANIYAPILLCTVIWLDVLLTYLVCKLTLKENK